MSLNGKLSGGQRMAATLSGDRTISGDASPSVRYIEGPPGKSAYDAAVEGGYPGAEPQFNKDLSRVGEAAAAAENASKSEAAAKEAQLAAEKARDEAQDIAGGNVATKTEAQEYANTAERNAKSYTDNKIASIPTPDVSKQINEHNEDEQAHPALRERLAKLEEGGNSSITFATEEPTEAEGENGELRLVPVVETIEKHRLPRGYTELEYIESTGTQYADTGFIPNGSTRVVMDVQLTSMVSTDSSTATAFFGSRTSASSKCYDMICASGKLRTGYNTTYETPFSTDPLTRVTIDKDGKTTTINGETHSFAAATFTTPGNLYLLALNQAGTLRWCASAKLYSCQVYDNGTLIRDYVPCINPSGVVGLYDMANGVFYADAAGGAFIAGNEAELETEEVRGGEGYFKVDGKWYELLPADLINGKFGKVAVGSYTGIATIDSSYNVLNPIKEVFVGFKPKFVFVIGQYIDYMRYAVTGVGATEYKYDGVAAWFEHRENFVAFAARPNISASSEFAKYVIIDANVTATDTGFTITGVNKGIGPNYKDTVYDFIAIG